MDFIDRISYEQVTLLAIVCFQDLSFPSEDVFDHALPGSIGMTPADMSKDPAMVAIGLDQHR